MRPDAPIMHSLDLHGTYLATTGWEGNIGGAKLTRDTHDAAANSEDHMLVAESEGAGSQNHVRWPQFKVKQGP
jgi:hypothetical protein